MALMRPSKISALLLLVALVGVGATSSATGAAPRTQPAFASCAPTFADPPGPFHGAPPVRSSTGHGHVISGTVRGSANCEPIAGARIELLPEIGEAHPTAASGAVFSDAAGQYRFESAPPAHIHIHVTARGYLELYTNIYHPAPGSSTGTFDIVLRPDPDCQYFELTEQRICGNFRAYWGSNGGLAQFGYPITPELREASAEDGKTYTVQYFERAVFEYHPENAPPANILLARLGAQIYSEKYPNGAPGQQPNSAPGAQLFAQTGKRVGGAFLAYWQAHGGLPQQGLPLSDEFQEQSKLDGKQYTVQYFERAVFELHPENQPPYDVLLAQLGTFRYQQTHGPSATGTVQPATAMALPRACHTATLLPNGKVLIAGGMQRDGQFTAAAELYDPASGTFAPTGSMTIRRVCQTATLLANGKVLIAGGDNPGPIADAELYDPSSGTFTATGAMLDRRDGHSATLLPNGKVLISGGFNGVMLASAELYDPARGVFSPAASMTAPRSAHSATLLPNGKVLIAGGGFRETVRASAELYDPASNSFTPTGSMGKVRYKQGAVLLPNGQVLLAGGADADDWTGRYADGELYDPASGLFTPLAGLHEERFKLQAAVTLLPNCKALLAGGAAAVEVYDPASRAFTQATGSIDAPRFYATATLLSNGAVLITGGYDQNIAVTAKTWLYK